MSARLAVLLSGHGSNLQALLDAIAADTLPARVVVVASNRRDAYGLQRARAAGIPTLYRPLAPFRTRPDGRAAYDAALAQALLPFQPEWIVLAGWMHILGDAFLCHFAGRVVNLHPALPGAFPGTHAISRAWEAAQRGELAETGVMVHLVPDERVDEGPVLATARVPIFATDTLAALEARVHATEHRLLVETLRALLAGSHGDA